MNEHDDPNPRRPSGVPLDDDSEAGRREAARREAERAEAEGREVEDRDDAVIGRAFGWSVMAFLIMGGIAYGVYTLLKLEPPPPAPPAQPVQIAVGRAPPEATLSKVVFTDVTRSAGIDFVLENGAYGGKLLPETMCGGCAFLDYDNDRHQDLLLINATRFAWDTRPAAAPTVLGLYHNDGRGNFTNTTAAAGLAVSLYGMGVAVGDYDNDGWVDVFVAGIGGNRLFHNDQGKFTDVTSAAGVAGASDGWSTSSGWLDYDRDQDLDLFVCNYIQWTKETDEGLECTLDGHTRAYCRVDQFKGAFPYLYRNDGDGRFTDVSKAAGVQVTNAATGVPVAKSLGLAPVDIDRDGWIDLIVANDTVQNFLFHNQRNGSFAEVGAISGIAFDAQGNARGAMGMDSGWFRNDATLGVVIGNFANEMSALYVSSGPELAFDDQAISSGLGPPSRLMLKFGTFFFDYDLDGQLDIFTANGHLEDEISKVQESQTYEQPPHLFANCGRDAPSEFELVPGNLCGPDFGKPMVGRGAAYADIDGDGDLDVLVMATKGPPRLLRNDQALGRHWVRIKLHGRRANRDAIGALVELTAGGKLQRRQVMPTRSYLSQCELPVTFGLGETAAVDQVRVLWPDGRVQVLKNLTLDELLEIEQPETPAAETASKLPALKVAGS